MSEIAEEGRDLPDARVRELIQWIREKMCPGLPEPGKPRPATPPEWNDTRIIIFTEYDDTKRYLRQQVSAALEGTDRADDRIAIYHGPPPPAEREEIKRAFTADPRKHPVRILIATDAAREGLNLQAHCSNLFHFDVPWNPSRMEQRNGRIDRKLQGADTVYCHYFVYKQRPEDRILAVLVRKTETIKRELGSLSQAIDARLADTLKLRKPGQAPIVLIGASPGFRSRRRSSSSRPSTSRQAQTRLGPTRWTTSRGLASPRPPTRSPA
jgi:superfamily II DNA/RNA helicase